MRNLFDHSQMMSALSLKNLKVREESAEDGQGPSSPPHHTGSYKSHISLLGEVGAHRKVWGRPMGREGGWFGDMYLTPISTFPGDIKQEGVGAFREGPPYQRRGALQLWQFLVALLDDPTNAHFIAWTGRGMEFKLIEPEEVGVGSHPSSPAPQEPGEEKGWSLPSLSPSGC